MSSIPFPGIAAAALARARELLPQWFPAGKFHGDEFCIGNVQGDPGESLKFNVTKGIGEDFASGEKFGDMIDLYAARFNVSLKDAAAQLGAMVGVAEEPKPRRSRPPAVQRVEIELPPADASIHPDTFATPNRGMPSEVYAYRSIQGRLRSLVVRWEADDSRGRRRKEFSPFTWSGDGWVAKAPPSPRPLFGLEQLGTNPGVMPIIVEGEKAATIARRSVWPGRPVLSWPGGAGAVSHADWSELVGVVSEVVIWPDADKAGVEAAADAAAILSGMGIEVSIIDVDELIKEAAQGRRKSGWDVADFVESGMARKAIQAWAKDHRHAYSPTPAQAAPEAPEVVTTGAVAPADEESQRAIWGRLGLNCKGNGQPYANVDNAARILSAETSIDTLHYDPFLNQIRVSESGALVKLRDDHILGWLLRIQREYGIPEMKVGSVQEAMFIVARARPQNSLQGWLRSLEWDGVSRVESLLPVGFGAVDNEFYRAVSRCFLVSLVARAMRPGCQVDTMMILEGRQGAGKSRGLEALAGPDFYADIDSPIGTQAHAADVQGKWLVEISELSGMRASEVERVKSGITRTVDVYREPYQRVASDHPRQCVYAGTTNAHQYLLDETGNRRFWCVAVGEKVDREWIKAHRAQLFAEALALFDQGASWWDVPADLASAAASERVAIDSINDTVGTYLEGRPGDDVTISGILSWLEIPPGQWTVTLQRRIAGALRYYGYRARKSSGKQLWSRADVLESAAPVQFTGASTVTPFRKPKW